MWHLKQRPPTQDVIGLLEDLGPTSPNDLLQILHHVTRAPELAYGRPLLDAAHFIPSGPWWRQSYANALLAVAARTPVSPIAERRESVRGQLLDATLAAIAKHVHDHWDVLDRPQWDAVVKNITRLQDLDTESLQSRDAPALLGAIRADLARYFVAAAKPGVGVVGEYSPFELAKLLADEQLVDSLLSVLRNWEVVGPKFIDTENRSDLAAITYLLEAVRGRGTAAQRAEAASWVLTTWRPSRAGGPDERLGRVLRGFARALVKNGSLPPDLRDGLQSQILESSQPSATGGSK